MMMWDHEYKIYYEIKDNFVYSVNDRQKLENEISALDKIGYKAKLCNDIPLPFKTAGAVRFSDQAQFNPLKFISAIAKDLNIFENTFLVQIGAGSLQAFYNCRILSRVIAAAGSKRAQKRGIIF